jgi:hypothetical protein
MGDPMCLSLEKAQVCIPKLDLFLFFKGKQHVIHSLIFIFTP